LKELVRSIYFILWITLVFACAKDEPEASEQTLFRYRHPSESGINFSNHLEYNEEINPYTFRNFFNGAGVGIGDLNQDGLPDLVLAGNMVSNKVYLNKGNLSFEDITEKTGIGGRGFWTTGISLADVNNDGLLDVYLCKSGPPGGPRRKNELFINKGNLTFVEEAAKFGLDFEGLSTQAVFLDFDLDEDLDCYLLNNSYRPVGVFDYRPDQRKTPDAMGGNRLLRNDGLKFSDVTEPAGIYSSSIGFGLGVAVGDVNKDGWPDMFVSNDFFEKDYLYLNNRNGTFTESVDDCIEELSMGSMGADMADINNDGFPEIYVTEMLPQHEYRLKTNGQFENWNRFQQAIQAGYGKQFGRNVLQLNNGDGTFSEIGRFSGVEATDWSWGALVFDMDNDGFKDIFVANGIYKDLLDQDYVTYVAHPDFIRRTILEKGKVLRQLIDSIPSHRLPNYAYKNEGNLHFTNMAKEWGLDFPTHSNGSAYGDLDLDGDLDLIINNMNMPAFLYENRSEKITPDHHSISLELRNYPGGSHALGASISAKAGGQIFYHELSPTRGFMSVVDPTLVIGIGRNTKVDTIEVHWPGGKKTILKEIKADTLLRLYKSESVEQTTPSKTNTLEPVFRTQNLPGLQFKHEENDFVDFDRDRLLFQMSSNEGPCLCSGDLDNNGLEDLYVGGAKGQTGTLFFQTAEGFKQVNPKDFEQDKDSEDTDCVIFDANGDGKKDLYVASGGIEYSRESLALSDRLYINQGGGRFTKSNQILPTSSAFESTSVVRPQDIDNDGDQDLFVGIRTIPFQYGQPCNGYILENNGTGIFTDITSAIAPGLLKSGMITDAQWADFNKDGFIDLAITGEWMGIKIFYGEQKLFRENPKVLASKSSGWYQALTISDVNNDGFPDLITGNHGLNSRFRASQQEPIELYVGDFDQNGNQEQILTRYDEGKSYPLVLRTDLVSQIPSLKKQLLYFKNYAGKQMTDLFGTDQLNDALVLKATDFRSSVWINDKVGNFQKVELPAEAQFFPVYAIQPLDYNRDGNIDLILGGNQYKAKPETGIYAAGTGLLLDGDGSGKFAPVSKSVSGLQIHGEIRDFEVLRSRQKTILIVARNNNTIITLTTK